MNTFIAAILALVAAAQDTDYPGTLTHTEYEYTTVTSGTSTETVYPQTAIGVTTYVQGGTVVTAPSVTTTADPITITERTTITPTTTSTVPTAAGFTPLSSESYYTYTTITTTSTIFSTVASYVIVSASSTQTFYTRAYAVSGYVTSTYTPTSVVQPVTTTTLTVAPAVQTVYDACAANNLLSQVPSGDYIRLVDQDYGLVYATELVAADEIECCSFCQGNATCTFSQYWVGAPYSIYNPYTCYIYTLQDGGVCDGSQVAGDFYSSSTNKSDVGELAYIVSNGPCGQFIPPDIQ